MRTTSSSKTDKKLIISRLERFEIGYEYDKTLQDIKRDVRFRTNHDI